MSKMTNNNLLYNSRSSMPYYLDGDIPSMAAVFFIFSALSVFYFSYIDFSCLISLDLLIQKVKHTSNVH